MDRQKNFLEDLSKEKPESFQEEVFVPANKKPIRIIATLAAISVVIIVFMLTLRMNDVKVPDMSGWMLEDVQDWISKYHENTILNGIHHKESEQNSIISQSIKAGKKIKRNGTLEVNYSLGADPNEVIEVPVIKNMTLSEIKTWISDNKMSGISIKYEVSEVVPKDNVISYNFVEGSKEEFLRKHRLVIYVSIGEQDISETIILPDFYGKTRAEMMQWAKENQIEINFKEVFNQYVDYGLVFEQSIKEDTKITRKDSVIVSISRGILIKVPDFTKMSRSEASELAGLLGISVFFQHKVSEEEIDTVINQDIVEGSEIDQKQIITIQIAKNESGIIVPDFKGLTLTEANNLAGLYGIKVFLQNLDEAGDHGTVTSQTIAPGNKIDANQIVTLTLNKRKEVIVPDFIGKSKNEAVVIAKQSNIELIFNEVETTKAPTQTVISQNTKEKKRITAGDSIILTIAVNSGIKAANIWNMSLQETRDWAIQKGITLNVIECYSSDYDTGMLFSQSCDPMEWIPANKVLSVYYSLGLVMVDNFIGKTKSEIIKWRDEVNNKGANLSLSFLADHDTTKEKGIITDQSIREELVALDENIQVWVSATDNGVLVKNFGAMKLEDFKLWCDNNSVPYIVTDCYSDQYEDGILFGQNYSDAYLPKNEYLRIYHSLGKVFVKDFTNQPKSVIVEWQSELIKKQAEIKIVFYEEYSSFVEKGKIIFQSIKDREIELSGTIYVAVSSGY
jgi:beta-lactam-binding protein with PASTA domain